LKPRSCGCSKLIGKPSASSAKRQHGNQGESRPSGWKCLAGGIEPASGPDPQRNGQQHREPERDRNPFEAVAQQRTRQDHAALLR
jgi:hypothetical protein